MSDPAVPAAAASPHDSPSGVWFAIEAGRPSGPWTIGALHDRVAARLVTAETPVWTDGMATWRPFAEVIAPDGTIRIPLVAAGSVPPPEIGGVPVAPVVDPDLPGTPPAAEDARTLAPRPWHRWFARILDSWCASFLYAVFLEAFNRELPDGRILGTLVILALMVPYETLCQAAFGTTPGKWLLNIRVREADGRRLTAPRALLRAASVWLFGMCAGLPVASLITMAHQHGLVKRQGRTSYDDRAGFVVSHGPVSGGRVVFLAVLVVGMIALIAIGMSQMALSEARPW